MPIESMTTVRGQEIRAASADSDNQRGVTFRWKCLTGASEKGLFGRLVFCRLQSPVPDALIAWPSVMI